MPDIILHECKRLRANITLAQCEANRSRPKERALFRAAPIRPHACIECEDWKEWTKENGMAEIDRIITRMMEAAKVTTQKELGEVLGLNIYYAKSKGNIPEECFEYLVSVFDADEQYLRTGVPSGQAAQEPDEPAKEEPAETTDELETEAPEETGETADEPEADPETEAAEEPDEAQGEPEAEAPEGTEPKQRGNGYFLYPDMTFIQEPQHGTPLDVIDMDDIPTEDLLAELLERLPWMTITIKGAEA